MKQQNDRIFESKMNIQTTHKKNPKAIRIWNLELYSKREKNKNFNHKHMKCNEMKKKGHDQKEIDIDIDIY